MQLEGKRKGASELWDRARHKRMQTVELLIALLRERIDFATSYIMLA